MGSPVLMVAYHFPPSGAVAAQRPSKFARYLPEFGWDPCVVARRPDPRQPLDPSFAGRPSPAVRLSPVEPARALGPVPGLGRLRPFFFVPDEEWGWGRALLAALPRWVARVRPRVLWASSVPTTTLVAAAEVARRMRLPLVADFHNEWTRNVYYAPPTPLHDRAHRALEARVVRSAALVTTLNPLHTEDLRRRFPSTRCETIENGFDAADYEVEPPSSRKPLVFTYAGAVYGHQSPVPFLRALARAGPRDVEVRIVGDRFGQCPPGEWPFPVGVRRHVPHRELGRVFSDSSAFFLCLETPAARQLPAKLYEYLRAGRPTFAIVPRDGAADRWLRETGAGDSVPFEEPDAWAPALREFIDRIPRYRPPAGERFHRRAQAGRLAQLLEEAGA